MLSPGDDCPLAPAAEPAPDGVPEAEPPACATAKAVLSARINAEVCRYFFMPVLPDCSIGCGFGTLLRLNSTTKWRSQQARPDQT
jgi:hypothetical protein